MSRVDNVGMFWQDDPSPKARATIAHDVVPRSLPPIPDTGWRPPSSFPDLSMAESLVIDLETKDPHLDTLGPGSVRRDGHIIGIAVAADGEAAWYFPMRHEVQTELNLDPDKVLEWARDAFSDPTQSKIGANLLYDLEWLASEGVEVRGPLLDVQIAEPLLDENRRTYSLDSLGQQYLGAGKTTEALYQWAAAAYGGEPNKKQAFNFYRCPPSLVGPYAQGDVDLPRRILQKQIALLRQQELLELFSVECRLIPMLLAMRRRGVRVDREAASRLAHDLEAQFEALRAKYDVDCWSADSVSRAFDKAGLAYPRTEAGAPSFVKDWLENHEHALPQAIAAMRKFDKAKGTFLDGYIERFAVGGRVHTQFNANKSDDSGTVSGRFSSTNPNLQNIPIRDKLIGPKIRGLYLPDEGERWCKADYSQIEPRIQFHYAKGDKAEQQRAKLRADPSLNCYRVMMSDMGRVDISYAHFKSVWLGISYGMGLPKMATQLGVSKDTARTYRSLFPPYILSLFDDVKTLAERRGYIRTILKRRARFDLRESRDFNEAKKDGPLHETVARERYGNGCRRAFTHKALNRLAQGSAADILKQAMVNLWESGVVDVLGAPLLTVHDELDWSVPEGEEALIALKEVKHIMENCVPLRVPVVVDMEIGPTWGELEKL